jgi:predicted CXXCH cytochrome family protein
MLELAFALGLACVAGGGAAALWWPPAGRAGRTTALALGAAIGVALAGITLLAPPPAPGLEALQPADATASERPTYASSSTCRSCHPGEYASWWQTYHRRMTQPVRADNIVGRFDGQTLTWHGRRYEVAREGERFMVDMPAFGTDGEGPGERWRRPVVQTTGSHHMQAYWIWAGEPATDQEREGQALFGLYCAGCHGPNGHGGDGPSLLGAGLVATDIAAMMPGAERGHPTSAPDGGTPADPRRWSMPPLDDAQRAAVEAFTVRIQFDGRLTQFPFVWLTEADRWVHEEASFLQPEGTRTDVEPPGDRWEQACDECHAVAPVYQWQARDLTATSAAVDLGIACEACHGPGREHVEHHRAPQSRYLNDEPPLDIVNPAKLDVTASRHVCGQCHAETEPTPGPATYRPGGDLEKDFHLVQVPMPGDDTPAWLQEALDDDPDRLRGSFWRDGTARVAGRDLNGMLLSGCAKEGEMTCLSCHQMHGSDPDAQLKPGMEGDDACLQCHEDASGVSLLTELEQHTHHPAASEGSRCQNCHMPYTTYGLLQAIRAHRVDSPNPLRTMTTGRPDACTLCHLDKSLAWAEGALARQQGRPRRNVLPPYDLVPMSVVHLTRGDAVQRAITAWHLRLSSAREVSGDLIATVPVLLPLLEDDYAAVRYLAGEALRSLPGFEALDYDFTASPAERARARAWASATFGALGPEARRAAAAYLGVMAAQPLAARVADLSADRDDDEVLINE